MKILRCLLCNYRWMWGYWGTAFTQTDNMIEILKFTLVWSPPWNISEGAAALLECQFVIVPSVQSLGRLSKNKKLNKMLLPTRHPWECLGCRCVYVWTTASCRKTSTFHFRLFPQRQSRLVSSRDLPSSPRTTRRLRLFPRETQASFPGFIMDTLSDKCMPMFTFTYNNESRTQHSLTRSLAGSLRGCCTRPRRRTDEMWHID